MGTQTMATQINSRQQPPIPSLSRQGSLYSLTLNEIQTHLGEPLHSMNLDDLLKNIFVAEDSNPYSSMDIESTGFPMNRAMSEKTVDELWRDIQRTGCNDGQTSNQTLGEMTLEDFLMKAGVVAEGMDKRYSGVGSLGFTKGPHWLFGARVASQTVSRTLGISTSAFLEALSDPQSTPGRKRGAREEVEEKLVERRQKRMIKNRESAARSRARKQAYTNELENKVSRLQEENERLRKEKIQVLLTLMELRMMLMIRSTCPSTRMSGRRPMARPSYLIYCFCERETLLLSVLFQFVLDVYLSLWDVGGLSFVFFL